jgi:AraC-like DNA-binding protein
MARLSTYGEQELKKLLPEAFYSALALADLLKVHPRTLSRRTRSLFGLSTQAWADQERLVAAPKALTEFRSVKVAAYRLGFKHPQQLSMIFKRHYGCCPTEFLAKQDREQVLSGRTPNLR